MSEATRPVQRIEDWRVIDGGGGNLQIHGTKDGGPWTTSAVARIVGVVVSTGSGSTYLLPWPPFADNIGEVTKLLKALTQPRQAQPEPGEGESDVPDAPGDVVQPVTADVPGEVPAMTDEAAAALLGAGTVEGGTGSLVPGQTAGEDDAAVPLGVLEEPGPDDGPPTAEYQPRTAAGTQPTTPTTPPTTE